MKYKMREKLKKLIKFIRQKLTFYQVKYFYNHKSLKLHLGCGNIRLNSYVNVDHRLTKATDMICDVRKLPWPENSVDEIVSFHVIEHITLKQAACALKEWHRVLKKNGKLVIECPDFDQTVREYLDGDSERIYNVYGRDRFSGDLHQFGYNFPRLKKILEEIGFRNVLQRPSTDYHSKYEPSIRVEATK